MSVNFRQYDPFFLFFCKWRNCAQEGSIKVVPLSRNLFIMLTFTLKRHIFFAGSEQVTILNPINEVLRLLDIELLPQRGDV